MIAQFENAFVGDVVDDIWSFLAASKNASACQGLKMPRNIGLGEPRRLHEPGYVLLPLPTPESISSGSLRSRPGTAPQRTQAPQASCPEALPYAA
jgi:hypothetical protein